MTRDKMQSVAESTCMSQALVTYAADTVLLTLYFSFMPVRRGSGVARICCEEGQRLKLCHGALTVDFGAGCTAAAAR